MSTVHRIHPSPPQQDRFELDVLREGPDKATIYVFGELDIATTPVLSTSLANLLDADTPCRAVVIDLSAAPFVDVGAANVLLHAHRRAAERGADLSLTGCSAQLVRLLHIVHVLDTISGRGAPRGPTSPPAAPRSPVLRPTSPRQPR